MNSVHDVAHGSLVTFDADYVGLRDAIMRLALTPTGAPRRGLLYSLLALSSIRRKGLQREALEFKVLALRALSASATGRPLSPAEAIQHVAACMLLGDFEVGRSHHIPPLGRGLFGLTAARI